MAFFDGHEAPTSLGSIYGYRFWNLVDGRLVSVSTSARSGGKIPWRDGENLAECVHYDPASEIDLPPVPTEPNKPDILKDNHYASSAAGSFFGEYVARARVTEKGGWSFPTLDDGSVVIPEYMEAEEYSQRIAEAKGFYDVQLADYNRDLVAWQALRDQRLASYVSKHKVPMLGCSCGFYMVKEPAHARTYVYDKSNPLIFGVCEGYGKVVVGERGWRFEKARIRALVYSVAFARSRVELTLNKRTDRIELKRKTVATYNEFSAAYSKADFYKTDEELRAVWDDRVENS